MLYSEPQKVTLWLLLVQDTCRAGVAETACGFTGTQGAAEPLLQKETEQICNVGF